MRVTQGYNTYSTSSHLSIAHCSVPTSDSPKDVRKNGARSIDQASAMADTVIPLCFVHQTYNF